MSTSGSQTKTGSHIITRSKARKNASKATGSDAIMTGGPHPTHQGHPSRVNMQQKNTSGPITRSRSLLQRQAIPKQDNKSHAASSSANLQKKTSFSSKMSKSSIITKRKQLPSNVSLEYLLSTYCILIYFLHTYIKVRSIYCTLMFSCYLYSGAETKG